MCSGIFTRKARELILRDKIQQGSINFTWFSIGNRSNRSAKKIIVVGIGKVTQFSIVLIHRGKQANEPSKTSEQMERQTEEGRIRRQGWSGGEENERKMANNVMREIRVCDGYLVCLDLCVDLPGNGARNPSCYLLSLCWFFPWRGKGDAAK